MQEHDGTEHHVVRCFVARLAWDEIVNDLAGRRQHRKPPGGIRETIRWQIEFPVTAGVTRFYAVVTPLRSRPDKRRVGDGGVRTCQSRGSPSLTKKNA